MRTGASSSKPSKNLTKWRSKTPQIVFAEIGFEQYLYRQATDKNKLRRINELIKSIEREGAMEGIGKPEKLKGRPGEFSRQIDDMNRLIYEVRPGEIIIHACRGHYDD